MQQQILIFAADKLGKTLMEYYESGEYIKPFSSQELADCVLHHAAAAGIAAMAPGVIPGIGFGIAAAITTGAVWSMYIKMSKMIGTSITEKTLKVIASAAISNIAMNTAVFIALTFIPGIGAIATGVINFAAVYAAGLIFLTAITRLFKVKRTDIENISDEEWKASVKAAVASINMKSIIKEAKDLFMEMRKNGSLDQMGKDVDISMEEDF